MTTAIPWRVPLTGRDPEEPHRAATPLELFFDLCFVVAVAAAAAALHHDLSAGHLDGLGGYALVFFGIWWAWVNYSWFASAYDSGDVIFRLTTFVIMAGVLVLAAGIPRASATERDFGLLVAGYVVMRVALIPMWLRVARDHPQLRPAALRYAGGIATVQVLWILWVALVEDETLQIASFLLLAALELAIPWAAETSGPRTPWHRHHIAERYQLFTIIVLGEVILATTQAISASLDAHGFSADLAMLVGGALLLVFSLWWLYFKRSMVPALGEASAFFFGYAHYLVLGAVAAVGAVLAASVDLVQHEAHGLSVTSAALLLAGAVSVYALTLGAIHAFAEQRLQPLAGPALVSALCFAAAALGNGLSENVGLSVLLVGAVVTGAVVDHQVRRPAAAGL